MAEYLIKKNPASKSWALEYAKLYLEEGEAEGVRGDGAWIQSCKETGNFKFTGGTAVTFDQNNFCGLGVTRKGVKGHSFNSPRLGIRAQIQHLKGYATTTPLKNVCVDPRYKYINPKGKALQFEELTGKWAVPGYDTKKASSLEDAMRKGIGYGFDIIAGIEEMKKIIVYNNTQMEVEKPMLLNIKTNLANRNNYGASRNTSTIKYLVIHYTANDGDTDEANGKYFANNVVKSSAHYFVDDDSITQSVPDNYIAYHCGANKYYHVQCRNANSIGIEMCDTKKNGIHDVSEKTLQNTIILVKSIMQKYNIPITNVLRHYDVTHKNCPSYFVSDITAWNNFKNSLCSSSSNIQIPSSPTVPPTSTSNTLYRVRKSWNDSTSQIGAYSSLENAKAACKSGYCVFDDKGNIVYPVSNQPSSNSPSNIVDFITPLVKIGLNHAKNFTGVDDSSNVKKAKGRVLQRALNLDYGKSIAEDGDVGTKSKNKLGSHYVKKGEKQYMVTAAEILMYLNNVDPNGVELPGTYGNGLVNATKKKFGGNGQKITASNFLILI